VCFEGAERGKSYTITKPETSIGRHHEADIAVNDELASRQHAKVILAHPPSSEEPECYIEDADSRNGTQVNGVFITSRVRLRTLDRVQIGTTVYGYVVKDETEVRVQETFFELATQDSLTGLNNRRQFMALMGHHVARAQRSGNSIALLVVDADHFKNVNDKLGHDVGDQVLAHIAGVIKDCCRAEELPARWGGEEFVVLLPDCDRNGAQTAGERIRSSIEGAPLLLPTGPLQITVSVGGAAMDSGVNFDVLFRAADQQLLRAKREGRNRAYVALANRKFISTAG
jgi:diguanylate cyclase (GGDEF)-like protein